MNVVRAALLQVGWGLALVLGQEAIAHLLNALGWRFALAREDAGAFALGELIRLRVAGDAINYLTPTATIGGEVARAGRPGPKDCAGRHDFFDTAAQLVKFDERDSLAAPQRRSRGIPGPR